MWLALTTPSQVRLTVVSKENPAGQATKGSAEDMGFGARVVEFNKSLKTAISAAQKVKNFGFG